MRSTLALLLGAMTLAGCDPAVGTAESSEALGKELAGRTAGTTTSCVSTFGSDNLRVVSRDTVAYGTGRTIYINRLTAACPALSTFNTIIVEKNGAQYCRGDHIRGLEPGSTIPGPVCFLGNWTAYSKP